MWCGEGLLINFIYPSCRSAVQSRIKFIPAKHSVDRTFAGTWLWPLNIDGIKQRICVKVWYFHGRFADQNSVRTILEKLKYSLAIRLLSLSKISAYKGCSKISSFFSFCHVLCPSTKILDFESSVLIRNSKMKSHFDIYSGSRMIKIEI